MFNRFNRFKIDDFIVPIACATGSSVGLTKKRGDRIKKTSRALWRWFNRFEMFLSYFWAMSILFFFHVLTKRNK